jgi:hypothetical protein
MTGRQHIGWYARARGLRDLSAAMALAERTLKMHLRAIYRELGAESPAEAVIPRPRMWPDLALRPPLHGPAGPRLRARRLIEVPCRQPRRRISGAVPAAASGYLGGNWELGAGGARLAVGAVAV